MPKIVDHAERKTELVQSAWRVIARRGVAGATLREIAAEAGFANGALKPYFPTKRDLLKATYAFVFERTNERIRQVVEHRAGLGAVLAFGREVLPLDEERRDEARVVIAFWQEALFDPELTRQNSDSVQVWRAWLLEWVDQAERAGQLRASISVRMSVDAMISFLLGAQVTATLDAGCNDPERLQVQLESIVDSWRTVDHPGTENLPV